MSDDRDPTPWRTSRSRWPSGSAPPGSAGSRRPLSSAVRRERGNGCRGSRSGSDVRTHGERARMRDRRIRLSPRREGGQLVVAPRGTLEEVRPVTGDCGTVCSGAMRRRTSRPVPDVFETFAHRVDSAEDSSAGNPGRRHRGPRPPASPSASWSSRRWRSSGAPGWRRACAPSSCSPTCCGRASPSRRGRSGGAPWPPGRAGRRVLAVGLPWARRQRDARSTSTSTP